ncbi:MAG: RnfABCDGE type electron transport complex subunit A [Treponema sp.]|nr:RnfABCDGE type electron transport complex subunit A [Treponema sp.]
MDYRILITIIISTVLVNNYVLQRFLGVCPFLGVSKEQKSAIGMSAAVIFVMILATAVTWPIYNYFLAQNGLGFLQIIVFILVIATLVQFVEIVLKKFFPSLYKTLGVYLPLMTTNCAIFAVTMVNIEEGYSYIASIVNAFGSGFGFFLAMVIFSSIRQHTENADPPQAFKGLPLILISAAILSFSFYGFAGVAENLFR